MTDEKEKHFTMVFTFMGALVGGLVGLLIWIISMAIRDIFPWVSFPHFNLIATIIVTAIILGITIISLASIVGS